MITENLSTLKIHKLTQAQYDRELENGTIDENALYLTPDEDIDLSGYALETEVAEIYETKSDASDKLDEAKLYTDQQVANALEGQIELGHTHDDMYYTELEIDEKIAEINAAISNMTSDSSDTYETKENASLKYDESKQYTDTAVNDTRNELLEIIDTKSEIGHTHAFEEVAGLQAALNAKSDIDHIHDDRYYTETEIDTKTSIINNTISDLTRRFNALADSDDTTLDQLSEIVAYIKSNKSLIDAITTSKVNVADIINNLTTSATNKPLSAAQGVALKTLIDTVSNSLNSHVGNKNNPHGVTAAQVGGVPTTRKVNGKALSTDISLTAADVGAIAKNRVSELAFTTDDDLFVVIDGSKYKLPFGYGKDYALPRDGSQPMTAGLSIVENGVWSAIMSLEYGLHINTHEYDEQAGINDWEHRRNLILHTKQGSDFAHALELAHLDEGQWVSHYVLHTGNKSLIKPADIGAQPTITGGATTIASSNLTASRALVSDANGKVAVSAVTSTELGYLDGVTSAIQAQLNGKAASSHGNHVPTTQTASNKVFLRNDNTWATVTPANIGAAASSHNHDASNITSGTLAVANGGTGVTSIAALKTALGISGNGVLGSGNYFGTGTNTKSITVPAGTKYIVIGMDYYLDTSVRYMHHPVIISKDQSIVGLLTFGIDRNDDAYGDPYEAGSYVFTADISFSNNVFSFTSSEPVAAFNASDADYYWIAFS